MYKVYAIRSTQRNYTYIGLTGDLANRLDRHNSGYERTTRAYRPFELVYTRSFTSRLEARVHEKWLKSGQGRDFLKRQFNDLDA